MSFPPYILQKGKLWEEGEDLPKVTRKSEAEAGNKL